MLFPANAASDVAAPAVAASSGSMAGNLFSTAFSLMLVIGVIFAIAWLMRFMQRTRLGGAGVSNLRINGGIQVGTRERVLMVQAGDKHLLIGVAPGRVQTLHVFDEAPTVAADQPHELSPFAERLRQLIQTRMSNK